MKVIVPPAPASIGPDEDVLKVAAAITMLLEADAQVIELVADPRPFVADGGDLLLNTLTGSESRPLGPVLVENAVGNYRIWLYAEPWGEDE